MSKRLLTLEETAKILHVSYARCAELARQGILPTIRLGRQHRVSPAVLDEFLASGGRALPGDWRREPGAAA